MTLSKASGVYLKAAVVAVILGTSVAGCTAFDSPPNTSTDHVDGGVLPFGESTRHECLLDGEYSTVLLGDIIGPPTKSITIDSVEMNGMTGLTVAGVFLLNPADGTPYATWASIPQNETIWDNRVTVVGATMHAGEVRNIIVQVTVNDGAPAQLGSVTVRYHSDSGSGSNTGLTSYEIANSCN